MPSVTVVVSSDTDIYISPGLYGDCLPTVPTGGTADSFRDGPVSCPSAFPSCSHTPRGADSACGRRPCTGLAQGAVQGRQAERPAGPLGHRDSCHTDTMNIVKVT
ncbi:hypothetical protein GTY87_10925 [Streptomyces sp. SID7813]|nr:hypothetical protein [Streptomyces sp. SID7813]QFI42323.1 hypothetical protein FQ762_11030 [Streptomyces coelicolor A3(2)]